MSGKLLLIYICNFHVLSHLLLIYICKLHWCWLRRSGDLRAYLLLLSLGEICQHRINDVGVFLRSVVLLYGGCVGRLCLYYQRYTYLRGHPGSWWPLLAQAVHRVLCVLHHGFSDGDDRTVCWLQCDQPGRVCGIAWSFRSATGLRRRKFPVLHRRHQVSQSSVLHPFQAMRLSPTKDNASTQDSSKTIHDLCVRPGTPSFLSSLTPFSPKLSQLNPKMYPKTVTI